jgi:hypothetical protein
MFREFRAIYPQGSIDSELLRTEQPYIVKASVCVGGWLLATGLGSGKTVEEAENKARLRALETLTLHGSNGANLGNLGAMPNNVLNTSVVSQELTPLNPSNGEAEQKPAETLPTLTPPLPSAGKKVSPSSSPKAVSPKVKPVPVEEEPEIFTPLVPELEEAHDPIADNHADNHSDHVEELFNMADDLDAGDTKVSSAPEPEPPLETAISGEDIDFNDIIARTNVELKRLNWSNEQGREYLLQTYGKRSRHLLSDEELIEFLQYLQSQT